MEELLGAGMCFVNTLSSYKGRLPGNLRTLYSVHSSSHNGESETLPPETVLTALCPAMSVTWTIYFSATFFHAANKTSPAYFSPHGLCLLSSYHFVAAFPLMWISTFTLTEFQLSPHLAFIPATESVWLDCCITMQERVLLCLRALMPGHFRGLWSLCVWLK